MVILLLGTVSIHCRTYTGDPIARGGSIFYKLIFNQSHHPSLSDLHYATIFHCKINYWSLHVVSGCEGGVASVQTVAVKNTFALPNSAGLLLVALRAVRAESWSPNSTNP